MGRGSFGVWSGSHRQKKIKYMSYIYIVEL
jgi:hypothetical protein